MNALRFSGFALTNFRICVSSSNRTHPSIHPRGEAKIKIVAACINQSP